MVQAPEQAMSMLAVLHQLVSISPIFCEQLFCTKVFCAAFMCLHFGFKIFWQKDFGAKAARKMLAKLTPSCLCQCCFTSCFSSSCLLASASVSRCWALARSSFRSLSCLWSFLKSMIYNLFTMVNYDGIFIALAPGANVIKIPW
jgi:hypothetical protein